MSTAVFIGDEISAAGYRLCGIDVQVADAAGALPLIRQACERAALVLVGSSVTRGLPDAELDKLLANNRPPVLVVPDVQGLHAVPDIAARVHKQLGMLE